MRSSHIVKQLKYLWVQEAAQALAASGQLLSILRRLRMTRCDAPLLGSNGLFALLVATPAVTELELELPQAWADALTVAYKDVPEEGSNADGREGCLEAASSLWCATALPSSTACSTAHDCDMSKSQMKLLRVLMHKLLMCLLDKLGCAIQLACRLTTACRWWQRLLS